MVQSTTAILLASGHARPIKTVIGQVPGILLGCGFLWLAWLSDWRDFQHFFLWLLLFAVGVSALGLSGYMIMSAALNYPKVVLMDGWLINFGLTRRTLHVDLSKLGKAEVVQFGRWSQTALAFHNLVEEAVLAKSGLGHPPTYLNASTMFPLTYSVGNDIGKAQEIADRINLYRMDFVGQVDLSDADVDRIVNRKMNSHIWGFLGAVGAAILVAVVLEILLPG